VRDQAELRRDHDAVAPSLDGAADEFLSATSTASDEDSSR